MPIFLARFRGIVYKGCGCYHSAIYYTCIGLIIFIRSATLPADEEHASLKKELAEVSGPSYDASLYEAFANKN